MLPLKILWLFVFTFSSHLLTAEMVQRMEPLFWWTNMNNRELQVKLYGPNIAQASVRLNYRGVRITRTERTDNPNYLFLYLQIGQRAQAGTMQFEVRKNGVTQRYPFELKSRKQGSAQRKSFSPADVVYLLMPDRFANGDTSNDSVPGYHQGVNRNDLGKRHGGDIRGIIQKIPYLADLGITALWTTPMFDNNDKVFSYHHYGTSNYYQIDPRLGTKEEYRELSEVALQHGIKLIIDVVPNHCSNKHWWMNDKPANNWFNEWPQFTSSNYRMMAWTDPHAAQSDLHRLTHGWFAPSMPDLNLKNDLLFDYLKQVYIFWIEYVGISGIRVDTYPYNNIHVASRFIQALRHEYPNMNVVGECWMNTAQEIAYFQSGNNNKDGFDSRMPSVMDFPLSVVFSKAFNEEEGWNTGMARFYMHFALDFAYYEPLQLMNFLDNHDNNRFSTLVNRDLAKYKMALAMLVTLRGYPQIYYGTEIMLDGIQGSYEGHRFTIPGGWKSDERNAFTAEGRTDEENAIFNYLRTLLHYRKNTPVLHTGRMKHFVPENGVYVYFRYNEHKTVMVVVNNNEQTYALNTQRFVEMLNRKTNAYNVLLKQHVPLSERISIPAKSVQIFEIN